MFPGRSILSEFMAEETPLSLPERAALFDARCPPFSIVTVLCLTRMRPAFYEIAGAGRLDIE